MHIRKPRQIAAARRSLKITQKDLGVRLGDISQQYISKIETGRERECSPLFARKLSQELNLKLDEVFDANGKRRTGPRVRQPEERQVGKRVRKPAR